MNLSLFLGERANASQDSSSVQSAGPAAVAQDGYSPNQVNTPLPRCATCDRDAGITPDASMDQSHGICPRHWCEQLLRSHLPVPAVRDRACRLFGDEIGMAAFDAATKCLALELNRRAA